MTPKEKCDELFLKYKGCVNDTMDVLKLKTNRIAKQCALIAVDEVIATVPQKENEIFGVSKGMEYWQQVKKHLEEL